MEKMKWNAFMKALVKMLEVDMAHMEGIKTSHTYLCFQRAHEALKVLSTLKKENLPFDPEHEVDVMKKLMGGVEVMDKSWEKAA